ncbi:peptidylprolyl isomerase [bacterium]|nr:peptidylprolyl isomerase [bacterium]
MIFIVSSMCSCGNFKDDSIVYVFKGDVVSVSDFKSKYNLWLRQNNMSDSEEMRKNYLFRELSEKFLYEMGKSEGVGDIPEIRNKIEDFKRKTIVEYMNRRTKREVYAIDDGAVRQYYIENKDQFLREKLYRLYAVRVTNRKKADDIAQQLRNGANIRILSASLSDDEMLARNNGEFGLFSSDVMPDAWKDDVLAGLPGEILGPYLDSENFYTIIEIAGFAYKRHLSFNLAYPMIVEEMIAKYGSEKWDGYRDRMMTEYGAKINVENLRWE